MELELRRKWGIGTPATQGELSIDGTFECFTEEDQVRSPDEPKVPGETAIYEGRYRVIVDWSNRFQKYMPHILGVPNFDGIRIHSGNTADQTEGCVLVGKERGTLNGEPAVLNSRAAFAVFFDKFAEDTGEVDAAHNNAPIYRERGETWITVVNEKEWQPA
jgi:hypothetical protein